MKLYIKAATRTKLSLNYARFTMLPKAFTTIYNTPKSMYNHLQCFPKHSQSCTIAYTTIYNAPKCMYNHLQCFPKHLQHCQSAVSKHAQYCQSAIGNFSTTLSMKVSAVCATPIGHLPQNCDNKWQPPVREQERLIHSH